MEKKTFNVIRYRGTPTKAKYMNKWVERQEQILIPEYGGFIPCAPYDDHFIFENPYKEEHTAAYLCTCGGVAVVVGRSGYLLDASPQGKMFVCLIHAQTGLHATGGTKWI